MRHNPFHAEEDPAEVERLIEANPWTTLVSQVDGKLVASHYPVLLDEDRAPGELTVVTHVGRPDETIHAFGPREILLIFAGPHGYVSPSWYSEHGTPAPTWNFTVAHCHGTPEILSPDENLKVLTRLVHHFEQRVDAPVELDPVIGERIARGTVGLRIPITSFTCKAKLSQDKDPESQRGVLAALRRPGPYRHDLLADEMARALGDP